MNLLDYLRIKTDKLTSNEVCLSIEIADCHKQPFGILHGGINAILIETACSMGANEHLNSKSYATGIDMQLNHLKSVSSGRITVVATPNLIGHSIQVWEAKIYDISDTITAVGRCTLVARKKGINALASN